MANRWVLAGLLVLSVGQVAAGPAEEARHLVALGRDLEARERLDAAVADLETRAAGDRWTEARALRAVAASLADDAAAERLDLVARAEIAAVRDRAVSGPVAARVHAYHRLEDLAREPGVRVSLERVRREMLADVPEETAGLPLRRDNAADARARDLLALVAFGGGGMDPVRLARWRGLCQLQLGALPDAVRELTAAVDGGDTDAHTVLALARALCRSGVWDRPVPLIEGALARGAGREAVDVLVAVLRHRKRCGDADGAMETARTWAIREKGAAGAPLWTFVAECRIERGELAEALDAAERVPATEQTWLLGGLTRLARADAAKNAGERAATRGLLDQYIAYHPESPGPIRLLDGDLSADQGEARHGALEYAASMSAGEPEAEILVDRLRARTTAAGKPVATGEMGELLQAASVPVPVADTHGRLLAGRSASYEQAVMDRAVSEIQAARRDPERVDRAVWMVLGAAAEPPNAAVQERVDMFGKLMQAPGAAVLAEADAERLVGLGRMVEPSLPGSRRELLRRYVKDDVNGALGRLDALALTAWKLDQAAALHLTGVIMAPIGGEAPAAPGAGAPAQLAAIRGAEAVLKRTQNDDEPKKLERVMEVAGVKTEWPRLRADPIVIDLDGNGQADLTGEGDAGVRFDLLGLGTRQRVQWLKPGHDGWLCEDGGGRVTSGLQLFGTAGGFADGFEKLARRDANGDGVLTGAELAGLSVWTDANGDGVADPGEVVPAATLGLTSIGVPKVGLRTTCTVNGVPRLACEVWPNVDTSAADAP